MWTKNVFKMILDNVLESFKSEFLELVREVCDRGLHRNLRTGLHLHFAYVVVVPCLSASVGPPVKTRKNYPFKYVVAASQVFLCSASLEAGYRKRLDEEQGVLQVLMASNHLTDAPCSPHSFL